MDLDIDLNLLVVLDTLLEERSVTEAAARLNRSVPATSRSLARIRRLFDDPILVRSGQFLLPTPRALEIQERVHELVEKAKSLTQPDNTTEIKSVSRTFTIAASDAVMCFLAAPLLALLESEAPSIKVFFVMEGPIDVSLRDSFVDMQVGIIRKSLPETRIEPLFHDQLVGVARADHRLFKNDVTLDDYVGFAHLLHSRRGDTWTMVDDALAELGKARSIAASVPTIAATLFLLGQTDMVSTCLDRLTQPLASLLNLRFFDLPFEHPKTQISLAWHPRFERDLTHLWMRDRIFDVFNSGGSSE
jgi:DNA-binding transcriptional LysR family regulator